MSAPSHNSVVLEPTAERMVPESSDLFTFWEHIYRYAFACQFVAGKRVLDIACGEGYGSAALQKAGASQVIGVDVAENVCLHARSRYGLDARLGSAEQIPVADESIDVIVSFETIEHIPDTSRFLDECLRILVPGGTIIISTPNQEVYGAPSAQKNPYHCSEMTLEEFSSALRSRFRNTRLYTQHPHSAAVWSARSLVSDKSSWARIRGFHRARRAAQNFIFPAAVKNPSEEQRRSAVDTILELARRRPRFLNPYLVRPQRKWDRETPVYIIATANR